MEEPPLIVKIKQEKLTPEREIATDDIEKVLDSDIFGKKADEDDKKEIEPTK